MADAAVLLADVDAPALLRMQAAFDLLDKADSLLTRRGQSADGTNFRRLLRREEALVRLERAFDLLPVQLRPRFKQWARESYERFYEDIKQTTMPSRRRDDGVLVAQNDPSRPVLRSWDEYVSKLMRATRNSSHGLQDMLREPPRRLDQARRTPAARHQQRRGPVLVLRGRRHRLPRADGGRGAALRPTWWSASLRRRRPRVRSARVIWKDLELPALRWVHETPPEDAGGISTGEMNLGGEGPAAVLPELTDSQLDEALRRLRQHGLIAGERGETSHLAYWLHLRVTATGLRVLGEWPPARRRHQRRARRGPAPPRPRAARRGRDGRPTHGQRAREHLGGCGPTTLSRSKPAARGGRPRMSALDSARRASAAPSRPSTRRSTTSCGLAPAATSRGPSSPKCPSESSTAPVIDLNDAGYVAYGAGGARRQRRLQLSGLPGHRRGDASRSGAGPSSTSSGRPVQPAALLDALGRDAATEEERTNLQRAAAAVRRSAPDVVRAALTGGMSAFMRTHLGL